MNKPDSHEADLLRNYIDTERAEKAPEDFTSRVMSGIRLENEKYGLKKGILARNIVPAVSGIVTVSLIILASVLPGNSGEPLPLIRFIQNINIQIPKIDLDLISTFELPEWIPYVFIGVFFLGLFDMGISGLFHRAGKQ